VDREQSEVHLRLNVEKLREDLRTRFIGQSIVFTHATTSTNDMARELANRGAYEGTVVVSETQVSGRGRLNRKWVSPLGGLWFSTILKPRLKPSDASKLTFAAGLAVAKTLHDLYDFKVSTKWPNDVLVNGKKVCGVLAEISTSGQETSCVVLGVGVNANFEAKTLPKELWKNTTSLKTELGRSINLERLFRTLLENFESTYFQSIKKGFSSVLKEWKTFATFLRTQVEVKDVNERWVGVALDVDGDGSLRLRLQDGTVKHVFAGDIFVRTEQTHTFPIEQGEF
jgi:BirA family biotin operon repressor/biotin-[acetyl-CoA-carboxylase] ligase